MLPETRTRRIKLELDDTIYIYYSSIQTFHIWLPWNSYVWPRNIWELAMQGPSWTIKQVYDQNFRREAEVVTPSVPLSLRKAFAFTHTLF